MTVQIETVDADIRLTTQKGTVRFLASNADFVRDALDRFVRTLGGLRTSLSAGGETVVSKAGGTDMRPTVWVSSSADDGASRGSVWLTVDEARAVLAQLPRRE